ncbi:MAG: DUF4340 domain-containing protein [Planctomycetota bacterium]
MMGLRAIVVLVLLAAGLGAVLWFTDEKPPTKVVATSPVLEGRSLATASLLRWQWKGRPPIEVGRGPDGRFQIQEPIVDLASAAFLKQICDAWDSAQMRRAPIADDDAGREKAGLAPPELVLGIEFADKARLDLEVGGQGPLGNTRFLRSHGVIWEGGDGLLESMRVGLDDLRERAVWRNAFAHATEVVVDQKLASGKRETLHLRLEGDQWRLLAPIQGRADPVAAQRFVTALLSLRVDDFKAGVVKFPDRPPEYEITVRGAHGEEHCRLWQELGQLFGQLPGRGVGFSSDNQQVMAIFENAAENLRARILVPMGQGTFADLVELVVDPGQGRGDRLRLVREGDNRDWRMVEPVEFAAAPTPCNEAAHALQNLVAREFVDDAGSKRPRAEDPRYGLGPGRLTVTARGASGGKATVLWLGGDCKRGDETLVFASRADEPDTVTLVPKGQVEVLARPWLVYCSLRILLQSAAVDRIDLLKKTGDQRRFQIEGGQWVLAGTPGARKEVGEFVQDELRDLVGVKAVDARGKAFDEPDWGIVLGRTNDDVLAKLRIWDRGAEQVLLLQGGDRGPVAFEVSNRLSSELRRLWQ